MPQGKGTYGSKVGRPSKKKYYGGGSVDPISTKNPEGVPAKQVAGAMEEQNMAKSIEDAMPTVNAMERSQTMPDTEQYKDGGKVKSKKVDVTDIVRIVDKRQDRLWEDEKKSVGFYKEHKKIKKAAKRILKGKKK